MQQVSCHLNSNFVYSLLSGSNNEVRSASVLSNGVKKDFNYDIVQELALPTLKFQQVDWWQSVLLVVVVLIVGLAKAFSSSRFAQVYKSIFNFRIAQEVCNEEKVFFHRVNILLLLAQLIIFSLFALELIGFFRSENTPVDDLLFPSIASVLLGFCVVKFVLIKLLAFVFELQSVVTYYIYNAILFDNFLALLFYPILILLYYTSLNSILIIQYVSFSLFFIVLIMRLIRLYLLSSFNGFSYVYLFVYICTLEILPLVVMLKIFIL